MHTACLEDMRAVTLELWANEPKELVPRLEELVILAKDWERVTELRVRVGTDPPHQMAAVCRHRLAAEAALFKARTRT